MDIRVTYKTGAQAAGIDTTSDLVQQTFKIRFVRAGYENCKNNILKVEEAFTSTPDNTQTLTYVLGSGEMPVAPGFINEVGSVLCPTTFTLEM